MSVRVLGRLGAPIFAVIVPLVSAVVAQLGLRDGRIAARLLNSEADVRAFLDEKIRGVRTVIAFGAQQREGRAFAALLDTAQHTANDAAASQALKEAANRVSIYVTIISLFLIGGLLICSGAITFEAFYCVTGFVWILNFAMQGISYSIADAAKLVASLKSIFSVLDKAQDCDRRQTQISAVIPDKPFLAKGRIDFKDVSFHYPSRPDTMVLKGINFSIRPGQMVALVGDSGGGKSTIAALLSRFYKPISGTITLDGTDIHSVPSEIFARQISLVDQDPILFQGSVRENIAYGLPDENVSDDAVIRAAKEAYAHEFISELSDGYDTVWTPASNFSGGQRQRIAISRSLIKSPPVLILDEATSALDQESERMVQSALEKVMKGRSVLIIAHRLSTVRSADAILFVKNGQIVERGTYNELVAKPHGHFRALVQTATDVIDSGAPAI